MQLVILCRTQGVNLGDFVFREGSNVAVHILDNIAIECGGVAFKELHFAAMCLLKDRAWTALTSKPILKGTSLQAPPLIEAETSVREIFYELSSLAHIQPLLDLPVTYVSRKTSCCESTDVCFLFAEESKLDWKSVCLNLRRCNAFSSCCSFFEERGSTIYLFYMHRHDVFLKLEVSPTSKLIGADIIEKEHDSTKSRIVFDTVVNCVLHYVWHNL